MRGKCLSRKVLCIVSSPRIPLFLLLVTTVSAAYFCSGNTYYDKLSGRLQGNKTKKNMVLSRRQLQSTQCNRKRDVQKCIKRERFWTDLSNTERIVVHPRQWSKKRDPRIIFFYMNMNFLGQRMDKFVLCWPIGTMCAYQCVYYAYQCLYYVYISVFLSAYAAAAAAAAKSLQSCPTLCDPIDGSPPRSPVPGILQARTLEWVAISFSNAWKWKVKMKSLNRVPLLATP